MLIILRLFLDLFFIMNYSVFTFLHDIIYFTINFIIIKGKNEMYLISIYFDEATEKRISRYMKQIGKVTGNTLMLDGKVPPHITIAAFHTESDTAAREIFLRRKECLKAGNVQWVSVGMFLPGVIYITPILNEYLHQLSEVFDKEMKDRSGISVDYRYKPFHWLPHSTLGKHFTAEQLTAALSVMQNNFTPFEGRVTKIGLAKTNPYMDLEVMYLLS